MKSFKIYLENKKAKKDVKKKDITKSKILELSKEMDIDFKDYPLDQLIMGTKVELEHDTDSKKTDVSDSIKDAFKIVLAHIKEDKKYYTKLKKMESE